MVGLRESEVKENGPKRLAIFCCGGELEVEWMEG